MIVALFLIISICASDVCGSFGLDFLFGPQTESEFEDYEETAKFLGFRKPEMIMDEGVTSTEVTSVEEQSTINIEEPKMTRKIKRAPMRCELACGVAGGGIQQCPHNMCIAHTGIVNAANILGVECTLLFACLSASQTSALCPGAYKLLPTSPERFRRAALLVQNCNPKTWVTLITSTIAKQYSMYPAPSDGNIAWYKIPDDVSYCPLASQPHTHEIPPAQQHGVAGRLTRRRHH
ncbi:hypothetical protein CBL_05569 [Carabus blaptoides fortunei]